MTGLRTAATILGPIVGLFRGRLYKHKILQRVELSLTAFCEHN